ncbi:helix-turn-helix domain-containing protein [Streptomyces sp. NPDC057617]|uniref:AraC-like ligand-binding domain-containing protein n=1 Tax=Streptomyces sp. NPDC057617 TaxID=3346184 RepID=UPI0036BCAD22
MALVATEFRFPAGAENFTAQLRATSLGPVQLSAMSYNSLVSRRTPSLIRKSDPELLQVALIVSGQQSIEQCRRTAELARGSLVLYSSSHPFEAAVTHGSAVSSSLLLQFPRALLPVSDRQAGRLLARPLPGHAGVGRLLARFLMALDEDGGGCTHADRVRLSGTALDLVGAVVAHHADAERDLPPDDRRRVLFLRVCAFVQERLGEADLEPSNIASAHHVSLRTLHRLFRQHGTSVAAFVRQQRLERCRRDILDPALRRSTIASIAARWGFPNAADFTCAFRTAYDVSPSEYRGLSEVAPSPSEALDGRRGTGA